MGLVATHAARDGPDMLAVALAVHLAAAHCAHHHTRKDAPCPRPAAAVRSLRTERIARRRFARLVRLALLERRAAVLEDLVVRAETHTPVFSAPILDAGHGLEVRDLHVDRDFAGGLRLRARVVNRGPALAMGLLEADLLDARGQAGRAEVAIDRLGAGEERAVEALCPTDIVPVRVDVKSTRF